MPGPIPNREEDLNRPRSRQGGDQQPVKHGSMRPVTIPNANADWNPIVIGWYLSLQASGQSDFYQQSDWAYAYFLAENMNTYLNTTWKDGTPKRSPEMLKTILGGMSVLLVTEGDRRRARLELMEEVEPDGTEDAATETYKKRLRLVK